MGVVSSPSLLSLDKTLPPDPVVAQARRGHRHLVPDPAPTSGSDPGTPVRSSNDGSLFSHEVVTRTRTIVMNRDEARLATYLTGEVAQTFIDVAHEVCP